MLQVVFLKKNNKSNYTSKVGIMSHVHGISHECTIHVLIKKNGHYRGTLDPSDVIDFLMIEI